MDKKKREDICSVIMAIDLIVTIIWIVWAGFLFFTSRPGSWKVVLIGLPISIILGLLLGAFYPGEANSNVDRKKIDSMDGIAFEGYCAQQLMKSGKYAKVQTTPPSGDFGADITAVDMNGESWVFQCKRYKNKLDNTPIQEVVAAKAHYNANHAAVITNSQFTEKARQLAIENEVLLIESGLFDDLIMY